MWKYVASLLLALSAVSGAAYAQVIIGSGIGQECYTIAVSNPSPRARHIEVCTKAIESNALNRNDLASTYVNRGILLMRSKDFESALNDYEKALQIRPKLGAAFLNKGAALISSGQPAQAIPVLQKSIELITQDLEAAYFNLGMAYELTGDVTSAYKALKKASELVPDWELPKVQLERYTVVSEG